MIFRPAAETPLSAYMVGELCAEVGFPPGVVNILCGPLEDTADLIAQSKIPSMLTLIGASATGCHVMRQGASSIKRYSMELGGNAPAIVFADADLEQAANMIALLKFSNAGQICVAPNRIFVHQSIEEEMLTRLTAQAKQVRIGHGKDSGATMGPLIHQRARTHIISWGEEALQQGASLVCGGDIPAD